MNYIIYLIIIINIFWHMNRTAFGAEDRGRNWLNVKNV